MDQNCTDFKQKNAELKKFGFTELAAHYRNTGDRQNEGEECKYGGQKTK